MTRPAMSETRGWQPIETAPRDGSHFLARQKVVSDEYGEDDSISRRNVVEYFTVVAYSLSALGVASDDIVQFPWNGGIPRNVIYTHWQPLPPPPTSEAAG